MAVGDRREHERAPALPSRKTAQRRHSSAKPRARGCAAQMKAGRPPRSTDRGHARAGSRRCRPDGSRRAGDRRARSTRRARRRERSCGRSAASTRPTGAPRRAAAARRTRRPRRGRAPRPFSVQVTTAAPASFAARPFRAGQRIDAVELDRCRWRACEAGRAANRPQLAERQLVGAEAVAPGRRRSRSRRGTGRRTRWPNSWAGATGTGALKETAPALAAVSGAASAASAAARWRRMQEEDGMR